MIEPGFIITEIKTLNGGDGWAEEGLQNNLTSTFIAVLNMTECNEIKMG